MVGCRTTHELCPLFTIRDRLATLREVYSNRMPMSTIGIDGGPPGERQRCPDGSRGERKGSLPDQSRRPATRGNRR